MKSKVKGERGGPENAFHNFIGVRQRKWGKWVAEIRVSKIYKRIWLGSFATAVEAATAYDRAAMAIYGPNCPRLNFLNPLKQEDKRATDHLVGRQATLNEVGQTFQNWNFCNKQGNPSC